MAKPYTRAAPANSRWPLRLAVRALALHKPPMLAHDLLNTSLPTVLATSLDAVAVMRSDGTVAGWNGNATALYGYTWAQTEGRLLAELIVPHAQRAAHTIGLQQWLLTGTGPVINKRLEVAALRADGTTFNIELAVAPFATDWDPVFIGFMRDITDRKAAEARKEWQVRELHHRVKNLLGVASSIAGLTVKGTIGGERFTRVFTGRLQAMGRGQEVVADSNWLPCPVGHVVRTAVEPHLQAYYAGRWSLEGQDYALSPRHATALVTALHELASNATEHGALAAAQGNLSVTWGCDEVNGPWIIWRELDGPVWSRLPQPGGGMRIISGVARHELRGQEIWTWLPDGLEFVLRWPGPCSGA